MARFRFRIRKGLTLIELQVTIVIVAIGIVSVTSIMATEQRLLKRLHASSRTSVAIQLQR
jgi:prepilin-type N-terminal cleavage/methylation domain-containing protein